MRSNLPPVTQGRKNKTIMLTRLFPLPPYIRQKNSYITDFQGIQRYCCMPCFCPSSQSLPKYPIPALRFLAKESLSLNSKTRKSERVILMAVGRDSCDRRNKNLTINFQRRRLRHDQTAYKKEPVTPGAAVFALV